MSFLDDLQDAQAQLGQLATNAQGVVNVVKGVAGSYPQTQTPQGIVVGTTGGAPAGGFQQQPSIAVPQVGDFGGWFQRNWLKALLAVLALLGLGWLAKKLFK